MPFQLLLLPELALEILWYAPEKKYCFDPQTYTANVSPIESAGNPRVAKCSL